MWNDGEGEGEGEGEEEVRMDRRTRRRMERRMRMRMTAWRRGCLRAEGGRVEGEAGWADGGSAG